MAAITLEELLKEVGVHPEKLNKAASDEHLLEITLFLTSWRTVASHLDLSENDLDDAEQGGRKVKDKSLRALQIWKGKFGFKATYRKLVDVLLTLAMADVAEKVCCLLKEDMSVTNGSSTELQLESSSTSTANGAKTGLTDVLSKQPEFQQLSPSEQEKLMVKLYDDEKNMKLQFGSLVTKTRESVEKRTTVEKFAGSVLALGAYEPVCEVRGRSLLEDYSEEINSAETISKIFIILNAYWNYLTYEVLDYIIKEFGDHSDKERLENYNKDLQEFCKRRIFELPPESGNDKTISPKQERFRVKLNFRKDSTCKDLLQIRGRIAKILKVNLAALVVSRVDEGCVQVTFLIPRFAAQELFPLSCEQTSALSMDASVITLECGHYIYENTSKNYTGDAATQSTVSYKLDGQEKKSQLQKEPHAHQIVKAQAKHPGQSTHPPLCPIDEGNISEISECLQKFDEIHTSYHNDFFLLRTRVLVNGENTEIRSVREGKYEGPVLNFRHSGSTVSTKLRLIATTVSPILVQYGIYHVDTFYYEQSPLFHVVFSSESCLKNFILAIGEVRSALESQFQFLFSKNILESSQHLNVKIRPDLFLVSPNWQKTKGAELHLVTVENSSSIVTQWKDSKLFDFGSLYKEEAQPPQITSQPTSQDDVPPGKAVTFSVQAIGTELGYKWQWKQFGRVGKKDEWQNLSSQGSTFKVEDIKASNAGYYRCVVSNSAGCETSKCASLTVVPDLPDLVSELQDVNDWVTFGLYVGIKMPRLEAIKVDCPTLGECRTQMLNEWQKRVTPTWPAVVQALVGIGMRRLAFELAKKYGVSPPKLSDEEPIEQLKNIPQEEEVTGPILMKEVAKRRGALEQDRRKLADSEEQLRQLQMSKSAVNEKVSQVMSRIEELHKKVRKIVQEKKILEIELQSKRKESQLLSEMKEKDAVLNSMLDEKISGKQKEIETLEKELQKRESDLQSAQQEASRWQEELLRVQADLKKKHKEVVQLKKENEKLSCSYSIEKEQVSKLIQFTFDLRSDKLEIEQRLVDIKEESESKSRQIEACEQNISHLSEEVEGLSHCLQQKEATVAELQTKLQSHEQLATTPETLSELLKLAPQIAELERRLQEAEYQKLQAELEREAAIEEVEAMQNFVALLHVQLDESLKITVHPKSLKEVWPGKPVEFTVQATGTDPLSYHWQWKPADEEGEWQPCRAECCDSATLTIPIVQKSNEGSYCCVISNCAGTQTSNPAQLSVADPPRITIHPQDLNAIQGKSAKFIIRATGTEPVNYHWQWKPAEEEGEWQPCPAEWCDGATVIIPSVQKSNEGSYCCVVSNCAGNETSKPANLTTCPPLQLPLQLRWSRCRDMEYEISVPHCVVLERSVYVGGGDTVYGGDNQYIIQVYNMDTDNWSHLPRYEYYWFAMTVINHHLTLVGGCVGGGLKVTNQLAVYDPSSQHWTHSYHPMPTPRYRPAVLMYDIWLLVAGGCVRWTILATVELLNTSTNQWLTASSLPTPCSLLRSAIVDDYGYLINEHKQVFRVSLPDIVSQTVDQSTASKSPWHRLPDTPLENSATITLCSYLIAVGGSHENHTRTDIHLYQPESEQWTKVGDLPNARKYCFCVVLPSGELLVAGGEGSYGEWTSRVDMASVLD